MLVIEHRDDLFNATSKGLTILTPNNRLSNQLLEQYALQTSVGLCDKIQCLPYQSFLQNTYKKIRHAHPTVNHPLLLNNAQQRYLWQQILLLSQDTCNEGLLDEVQDAWTRCQQWQIDNTHKAFNHTPQTRQFQEWQQQFQQRLTGMHAITIEKLVPYLLQYPKSFNTQGIVWVSFDNYTPQQRNLQERLEEHGCPQYTYDLAPHTPNTYLYAANDLYDESLEMIQWLKEKLASGKKRIGVVIPNLQMESQQLQRLIQRHIPADAFNISLGQPLGDYPLIGHALTWLRLDAHHLTNHQARLLLHSPYLQGSKTEFNARSEIVQNSKVFQEPVLAMPALIKALQPSSPILAEILQNLSVYPDKASPTEWINYFKKRLINLGFPGEYPLNSASYQCFQRFITLLDELLQFSVIAPALSKTEALDALQMLAKLTIFQLQKASTAIQILGLLEASGCTFDSLWVAGLTDQCLPQKPNLSAFIPIDLQRDYQMPHASVLRELQLAEQVLQRLQNGSEECIFSYPKLTGEIPNLPSPLIKHFPLRHSRHVERHSRHVERSETSPERQGGPHYVRNDGGLVVMEETYLLPLTPLETISGGTALLAYQAQCPFRAFAAHRLFAKPGLMVTEGPDASERGQVLHRILDLFWQETRSQQKLLTLKPTELKQRVEFAIAQALKPIINSREFSFTPLVQDVEIARLSHLIHACLEWEKQRQPFEIEALEENFTLHLAGLDFRVRVDRLDRLNHTDEKWVIDYKSSLPPTKPWNDERPEAPQILLYALLDEKIKALLFLQLKAGRVVCSGLSELDAEIPGINSLKKEEHWSDYQQRWKTLLTQLATEFKTGYCAPIPSRSSTCQQCEFSNLCRIEYV